MVNLKGRAFVGTAIATFDGPSGQYDIVVVYHDENDGAAQLSLSINGDTEDDWTWILDQVVSHSKKATEFNRFSRRVVQGGFTLDPGDSIQIDALQGGRDNANVDYIEIIPASMSFALGSPWHELGDPPKATYFEVVQEPEPIFLASARTAHVEFYSINATWGDS